jgi:two-component system sensor histidine kinase KdpD
MASAPALLAKPRVWLKRYGADVAVALMSVTLLTAALAALQRFVPVETVTIIYLIPVLVGAIRGGVVPAVIAALAAIGAAAFFFYEPLYDFRVHNPVHLIDLLLFVIVAVVTGQLATGVRQAKMRAESEALRDALIGSVSHELRTPLSSIVGSASVLAQSHEVADNPRLRGLLQVIQEEAERLNADIQNLIDASFISTEGLRPDAQWVEVSDIVNAVLERKRRLLANHRVSVSFAPELPLIEVDPVLVEKALGQLIENAANYSPPSSSIAVTTDVAGGTVRIAITDQGMGLTAEEHQKIWERFYRSPRHGGGTRGSGLGLWIAAKLLSACGGRVEAFSAGAGQGATFEVRLPVTPSPEGGAEQADE